ncbi:MAG TPA: hypothetical protein VMX16_04585 [Terriglobia bacterium]|nr:hypothetical protein [Terriglobia bacterium]
MPANWDPAEFHHWHSKLPHGPKGRAWNDLRPDQQKVYREWWAFEKFASVAPLDVDPRTIENRKPPEPDIRCRISGKEHYFELGEVTDKIIAQKASEATKRRQHISGGWFSQLPPLWRIFKQKCSKIYLTSGRPLHLLLYYAVGHQFPHTELLREEISKGHQRIVSELQKSPFSSVWLYDQWDNSVIAYVQR